MILDPENNRFKISILVMLLAVAMFSLRGQQESQFTQYMYNTQTINPGYTGSRQFFGMSGLYRDQWMGVDGAPTTLNFTMGAPVGKKHIVSLGASFVRDRIGPASQNEISGDFSYNLDLNYSTKLALGLKVGVNSFTVDYSQLNIENTNDEVFLQSVDNGFNPTVGVGFFLYQDLWYFGASIPNVLSTRFYDVDSEFNASRKSTVYLIGGYVFDLSRNLRFKPATLLKATEGAPVAVDVSANFLLHNKVTLGVAYRWDAAISGLIGFQITPGMMIGIAYDNDITEFGSSSVNSDSFEFFLRTEIFGRTGKILTPRFF